MTMAGRETRGWLLVGDDGLRTTRRLAAWVARGVRCAKGLPPR